ncbi:MAG: tRNA glutamyl-Q(34) synthetase GluQRS [Holophagales bacterium]|nr:tRNA glutamyl-Q(34) synthetase GluQRS [Holophagales bacterium]
MDASADSRWQELLASLDRRSDQADWQTSRCRPPRGRYAPTPSGWIHVGNARTALAAWLSIRSRGGTFVWRLEDLDPPRALDGAAEAAVEDLAWLGLDWDEGPSRGGPFEPYVQSERSEHYRSALRFLAEEEQLFPCRRSRKDLQELATAPHGAYARSAAAGGVSGGGLAPYPAAWRPKTLRPGWLDDFGDQGAGRSSDAALRFRVSEEPVRFVDRLQGEVVERVDLEVGDFVLQRRDGLFAYQLAVVVDDLLMGITEVVRGVDLLDSTARQIQLLEALAQPLGTTPRMQWAHLPLVLDGDGEKLSKRHDALTLRSLRADGIAPERLVGYLAHTLGLLDRPQPCRPEDLLEAFAWEKIPLGDHRLPEELLPALP